VEAGVFFSLVITRTRRGWGINLGRYN
jgi:hypothetical protein